jgi:membrane glycosyltransferase
MFAWLSPAVAGLMLAVPVSAVTAGRRNGVALRRAGLLRVPEEAVEPTVANAARALRPVYAAAEAEAGDFVALIHDERRRRIHRSLIDRVPDRPRGQVDPLEAVAFARIAEAQSPEEAISFLTPAERAFVLASPDLFEVLADIGTIPAAERGALERGRTAA